MLDPAPPDSPFRKGKVEAAGKCIERALIPPLPGYLGAGRETRAARSELMGFPDLVDRPRAGIDAWNRTHAHPVLGCTLAEAWERDATPVRAVAEDRLRWMMLAEERRKVQREGVRLGGLYFTAPELTGRRGEGIHALLVFTSMTARRLLLVRSHRCAAARCAARERSAVMDSRS